MKTIAMYLPQFHRIPENDAWWGEGFTEWTAVKAATPQYENHYQPHIPLNGYYDLSLKETMQWQERLMKQYKIDGLCFYHYWFKDGKKILEKPSENLLKWTDIDIPYCFCWANETWARSWSKLNDANAWTDKCGENDKGTKGVLLEQVYGRERQWKEHFEYLMPFFEDRRYIRVSNRPVFMIYKSNEIKCLKEMIVYWHSLAEQMGIEKPYIIARNTNGNLEGIDAEIFHEPFKSMSRTEKSRSYSEKCIRVSFDEIWDCILRYPTSKKKTYYGGFVGFDNTPRFKYSTVIEGASPDKFKVYLSELMAKNAVAGNEFVFINAWNEWGEGMHLEPDVKFGYGYLEAVPYAKDNYKKYIEKYEKHQSELSGKYMEEIHAIEKINQRYAGYWRVLDKWMTLKENQFSIEQYLVDLGIRTIAIYGMGMLGKHLLQEFTAGKIQIKYIIERKEMNIQRNIPIYTVENDLPQVDAIIVTPFYEWREIKEKLEKKTHIKLISLEELMQECFCLI